MLFLEENHEVFNFSTTLINGKLDFYNGISGCSGLTCGEPKKALMIRFLVLCGLHLPTDNLQCCTKQSRIRHAKRQDEEKTGFTLCVIKKMFEDFFPETPFCTSNNPCLAAISKLAFCAWLLQGSHELSVFDIQCDVHYSQHLLVGLLSCNCISDETLSPKSKILNPNSKPQTLNPNPRRDADVEMVIVKCVAPLHSGFWASSISSILLTGFLLTGSKPGIMEHRGYIGIMEKNMENTTTL